MRALRNGGSGAGVFSDVFHWLYTPGSYGIQTDNVIYRGFVSNQVSLEMVFDIAMLCCSLFTARRGAQIPICLGMSNALR